MRTRRGMEGQKKERQEREIVERWIERRKEMLRETVSGLDDTEMIRGKKREMD